MERKSAERERGNQPRLCINHNHHESSSDHVPSRLRTLQGFFASQNVTGRSSGMLYKGDLEDEEPFRV